MAFAQYVLKCLNAGCDAPDAIKRLESLIRNPSREPKRQQETPRPAHNPRVRCRRDPIEIGEEVLRSHWALRSFEEMTPSCWAAMRQHFSIRSTVVRRNANLDLRLENLPTARWWGEMGLEKMSESFPFATPIQLQVIPIATAHWPSSASEKLDVLAVAPTGSGKTLCYAVPCATLSKSAPAVPGCPVALVVVPTRELARQAAVALRVFGTMDVVEIVGGVSVDHQHNLLDKGVRVVVGTAGQLKLVLENSLLSFSRIKLVCIDEVDMMVEEPMASQLCDVLEKCPSPRQTLAITATLSPESETMVGKYLSPQGYVSVAVSPDGLRIAQYFEMFLPDNEDIKIRRLQHLCASFPPPVMVFVDERTSAEKVASGMRQTFMADARHRQCLQSTVALHGDLSQDERTRRMALVTSHAAHALVATDVAARGIDLRGVSLVVNFGPRVPSEQTYTHRIGRTGRAGQSGCAITFVTVPQKLEEPHTTRRRTEDGDAPSELVQSLKMLRRRLKQLGSTVTVVAADRPVVENIPKIIVTRALMSALDAVEGIVEDATEL